ncbi:AmmeMemoRadiSam system protein A [Ectothiorhodospiraceae bacterium WFHF3C12]|nr:AmmeMemoRadiSam system protein A [Ectothiorhodospiraceae bacterium WFHF3C12]
MLPPEAELEVLEIARDALVAAAEARHPPGIALEAVAPALREPGAAFVTLHAADMLRGCVGTLEACRALAEDVAANARAAALRDPRFPPLVAAELGAVRISVTIIGPARPLEAASEAELLETLRPGVDGLTLELGAARATFLPAVWAQLPEPAAFLHQLRRKAGLPGDYWSPALRFSRYQSHTVEERGHARDSDADYGAG